MTEPLSPAAQAVLDGFRAVPTLMDGPSIAGALRAVADQVVPEQQEPVPNEDSVVEMQGWACVSQRQRTRSQLLAIAAELEGQ
jgi:hypothetical protein